jgi:hypothetical protein
MNNLTNGDTTMSIGIALPMMSESIAKLTEALSKAQGKFDHAKKDIKNEFFKSKYADLASVIDAAKNALSENGLAVIQTTNILREGDISLVTILSHASGEWIKSEYPVIPVKKDPQGMGSALTYARRYCFSAITGIASDDDDDGNAASGNPANNNKPEVKKESAASRNKRFAAVKEAIASSDDPAFAWQEHIAEINEFRATPEYGETFYDDLVQAGKKRREELQLQSDFAARA